MSVKTITSRDNGDYKQLLALADSPRARREAGLTLLDGEHLIREAVDAGLQPSRLIYSSAASGVETWLARLPGVSALELSEALFNKLSPVASPSGILAILPIPSQITQRNDCVLLLDGIQDPGNLGAILRTAAATGVSDVHLSADCTEAWSPKALRGGQGGHFRLALHEGVDLMDWVKRWPDEVYAALPKAGYSLYDLDLLPRVAFAFGNEGAGLNTDLAGCCKGFSIPMQGGVESLNVAVSVGVCLYERVRQQSVVAIGAASG